MIFGVGLHWKAKYYGSLDRENGFFLLLGENRSWLEKFVGTHTAVVHEGMCEILHESRLFKDET